MSDSGPIKQLSLLGHPKGTPSTQLPWIQPEFEGTEKSRDIKSFIIILPQTLIMNTKSVSRVLIASIPSMHNQFRISNIVTKGIKQKLIQGNCLVALKPSKDKLSSIEDMEIHSSQKYSHRVTFIGKNNKAGGDVPIH